MASSRQLAFVLVLLVTVTGASLSQRAAAGDSADAPFITVNDKVVSYGGFVSRMETVPVQTQGGAQPVGEYTAERIVMDMLILQLAAKQGVSATDEQINTKIARWTEQSGGNLNQLLTKQGVSLDDLKRNAAVAQSLYNLVTAGVNVSDKEVQDAYGKALLAKNSKLTRPEQVMVSAIISKNKADVDKAYKLLEDGKGFGAVAAQCNDDPAIRERKGSLNWIQRNMPKIPKPFLETAFSLPIGKYSKPFAVDKQYVILKADQKRPARTSTLDEVRDELREQVAYQKGLKENKNFEKDLKEFAATSSISITGAQYMDVANKLRTKINEIVESSLKETQSKK